ncbi:MAG: EscU/YscU/HrcU family type III secretion system export apparatus switch protein, partial [Deltaproteobacteria bacterium]|nr:EscU/YscU/HrcU family type III secretion system export apparatus switch protein [Deltaproteobacteria bacterium]
MSEEDKHSKSEQPTEQRLLEAGKKSPPAHSRDLTSTVTLLAAILAISWTGKNMLTTLMESSRKMLLDIGTFQVTTLTVHKLMVELIVTMGMVLGPVMLSAMMAGIAINFAQGGIVLSSEKLTLNYDRLNPLKGLKKIFNMDAGMEMLKSTLKIAVVGYMSYSVIRGQTESLTHLSDRGIVDIFDFVSKLAFKLVVNSCSILLILSFFDLLFVKWRHKQNLMMTKQEVKQEHKEADGDPKVKGKIRRI